MRLGGSAVVNESSLFNNLAYTRGLAVAVVGSATIGGSFFDGNQLSCANGSYRSDTEQVKWDDFIVARCTFGQQYALSLSYFLLIRCLTTVGSVDKRFEQPWSQCLEIAAAAKAGARMGSANKNVCVVAKQLNRTIAGLERTENFTL